MPNVTVPEAPDKPQPPQAPEALPYPEMPEPGSPTRESVTVTEKGSFGQIDPEGQKILDAHRLATKETVDEIQKLLRLQQDNAANAVKGYEVLTKKLQEGGFKEEPPVPPEGTPAPSKAIRPFAQGLPGEDPYQSLQRILFGLGTLAQTATGLMLKYPEGALAAFTGAMQGWAEGDAARGDREFDRWKAETTRLHQAYERRRQRYKDLMDKYGMNQEQLKTEMAIMAHKEGASKEMIQAALQGGKLLLDQADKDANLAADMLKHGQTLTVKRELQRGLDEMKRYNAMVKRWNDMSREADRAFRQGATLKMLDLASGRLSGAQYKQFVEPLKKQNSALGDLDILEKHVRQLEKDGLLPSDDATRGGVYFARFRRDWLNPSHPSVAALKTFLTTVMTGELDRQIYDEKGVRSVQIFLSQLDLAQNMPSANALVGPKGAFGTLRESIRRKMNETTKAAENARLEPGALLQLQEAINQHRDPAEQELMEDYK